MRTAPSGLHQWAIATFENGADARFILQQRLRWPNDTHMVLPKHLAQLLPPGCTALASNLDSSFLHSFGQQIGRLFSAQLWPAD